jgi:hypothetical protein
MQSLRTGNLPWTDMCMPGQVALKASQGERPRRQLRRAKEAPRTAPQPGMERLISDCWEQDPAARPTFGQVIERLRRMMDVS